MVAVVAAAIVATPLFILGATRAHAFWFFPSPAAAQTLSFARASGGLALAAATNPDPNPYKNGGELSTTGGSALVADSGPAGTLADVEGVNPSGHISLYVVRTGDTLSDISRMFNVSINTIVWANDLGSAKAIRPGQELVILPVSGIEHTVLKGETLAGIAKKFRADATEIAEFNGLEDGAALAAGTTLIIPGGELAAPVAPTRSSSSTNNPYKGGSGAELDGYYTNPVPGAVLTQGLHGYNSVDLGAARGTPIRAAAAGTVIVSKNNGAWNGGYGNYVVITHGNGTQTLYAHMTSATVSVGQSVSQAEVIGYVGRTGEATGYHLHFETRGARNPFVAAINAGACRVGAVCTPR